MRDRARKSGLKVEFRIDVSGLFLSLGNARSVRRGSSPHGCCYHVRWRLAGDLAATTARAKSSCVQWAWPLQNYRN